MTRRIFPATLCLLLCALITLGMASCRKGSINGDLDGQWQIMEMEDLVTGETTPQQQLYYCLYLHTVNLTGAGLKPGNMTYEGKHLILEFPLTPVSQLKPWGIYASPTDFEIEHLTSSRLVMKSDRVRIHFRKY